MGTLTAPSKGLPCCPLRVSLSGSAFTRSVPISGGPLFSLHPGTSRCRYLSSCGYLVCCRRAAIRLSARRGFICPRSLDRTQEIPQPLTVGGFPRLPARVVFVSPCWSPEPFTPRQSLNTLG